MTPELVSVFAGVGEEFPCVGVSLRLKHLMTFENVGFSGVECGLG